MNFHHKFISSRFSLIFHTKCFLKRKKEVNCYLYDVLHAIRNYLKHIRLYISLAAIRLKLYDKNGVKNYYSKQLFCLHCVLYEIENLKLGYRLFDRFILGITRSFK